MIETSLLMDVVAYSAQVTCVVAVGAMLAAGPEVFDWGGWVGVAAVVMASINAFGGFLVTQRMLEMFRKKEPKASPEKKA